MQKEKELKLLEKVYENCGHIVRFISVKEEEGIDEIRELIHGKTDGSCWTIGGRKIIFDESSAARGTDGNRGSQ